MPHSIEQTDILFYLTNMPTPRMQKHMMAATHHGHVTIIYWKRYNIPFQTGLSGIVLEVPVKTSFSQSHGFFRLVGFFIYALKSWLLLRRARRVKKVYVNYLDVLLVAYLKYWKARIEFIYAVGDLASVQYGGNPVVNKAVSILEKILLKKVTVIILSSPFFWTEYYAKIHLGRWELIENKPEAKIWANFKRKQEREPCVVGFFGTIRDHRPIEALFAAVREIRETGHDIRVFFAGFGPEENHVRNSAAGLDFVSFYGPYQYNKEAPELYGRVDIIFSVFDIRTANAMILYPNRFYECAICGLPIIVARHTKLEAYMKQYGTGYSVEFLSAEDIKKALLSHIENDEQSVQIKKALDSIDKSKFFYDQYYPLLKEIFEIGHESVNVTTE